jgi:hypothetical protein
MTLCRLLAGGNGFAPFYPPALIRVYTKYTSPISTGGRGRMRSPRLFRLLQSNSCERGASPPALIGGLQSKHPISRGVERERGPEGRSRRGGVGKLCKQLPHPSPSFGRRPKGGGRVKFMKQTSPSPSAPPLSPPPHFVYPLPLSSLFYPLFLIYAALQQYGKRGERGEGEGARGGRRRVGVLCYTNCCQAFV